MDYEDVENSENKSTLLADLSYLFTLTCSSAIVFGGVVPYIPQYREIKRSESSEGFSLYVCLVLLVANVLRILFWFGNNFEIPLLMQSIVMIVCMMVMLHLCTYVNNKTMLTKGREHVFTDFDWKYFWKWTDFQSYLEFMLTFMAFGSFVMYLLIDFSLFVEIVGFLSLFTEAMLGLPQLYKNFQSQSTRGMSNKMVLMWTCGDTFKTLYFIFREAPVQFWLCGSLQVVLDLAILTQVLVYNNLMTGARRKKLTEFSS